MRRFVVIVRRDRARQLQILRAHVRKCRIIRLLRPIEERCRAHEGHPHHDYMLHRDRIQDLLINMQRRRNSERPCLTDMILLHDHRSGEFPHLIIHLAEFLRLHLRDIQSVKVMVQEHRDDPRLAARENDRIDVILSDRYPERLHDRMNILRQRFREITRLTLVRRERLQKAQRPDVYIVLVAERALLPHRQPHAARRDVDEEEILPQTLICRPVILLQLVRKAEMLEIDLLRHVHDLHIESRLDTDQIQDRAAVVRLTENRRRIRRIYLHLIIRQQLLQAIQHAAELPDRSERQILMIEYLFPKVRILPHGLDDTDFIDVLVLHDAKRQIRRADVNDTVNERLLFRHKWPSFYKQRVSCNPIYP